MEIWQKLVYQQKFILFFEKISLSTCISMYMVTLRCKKFSYWLTQNVWGIGFCCHVWPAYGIGIRTPIFFSNNRGMLQIICICMPLITMICLYDYPLSTYYVPYAYQCQYLLRCNLYNYCNICPNPMDLFLSSTIGWAYCNRPTWMSVGGWVHLLGCVLVIFCSHLDRWQERRF